MEYLSNNQGGGGNCLGKWSTHKLSFSHMSRKWINFMIFFFFNTVCILMLYKLLYTIIKYRIKVKVNQ